MSTIRSPSPRGPTRDSDAARSALVGARATDGAVCRGSDGPDGAFPRDALIVPDLGASATAALWITDVYGFLITASLLTMGSLADRLGPAGRRPCRLRRRRYRL